MQPIVDGMDCEALEHTARVASTRLLSLRGASGHWTGRLSSSALATATAITALRLVDATVHGERVRRGAEWLVATQRDDGSWGDTVSSRGNLSTTLLCWAALAVLVEETDVAEGGELGLQLAVGRSAAWIESRTGDLGAAAVARALAGIYGRDRTFSVPILTHLVLCGRFGDPRRSDTWREVPQLPFELAALPQSWFRFFDMQVVSYAMPALIAIGQVRHRYAAGWTVTRSLRDTTRGPTLEKLSAIQPANGGYLEATPLTSFVTMSLAGMGMGRHPVACRGADFLAVSQRTDGSWSIDTNLATWVTTQAVAAMAAGGRLAEHLDASGRESIRRWLLDQQWQRVHPATGARAGGWAWTDLPGGVPDADDTSGAVAALAHLEAAESRGMSQEVRQATRAGLHWLALLANRDGGIPTFCRGWGRLPFDTSCPDISAHVLRALDARGPTSDRQVSDEGFRLRRGILRYLSATQAADGSWRPLWFGNEHHGDLANPTYGTARVVLATLDRRGAEWLVASAGADGGWGGGPGLPASIEETAIAVESLARVAIESADASLRVRAAAAVAAGVGWLVRHTSGGAEFPSAPIGLYFAKLWYDEELYPVAFTVAALERAQAMVRATSGRVG